MDLSNLKRDSGQIEAGQWVSDIPGMDDLRLRVRGLTSPTVSALRGRKQRKVSKNGRNSDGTIKSDIEMRIFGEVLFEVVLLEWDGLTDNGKPVPYDRELAKQWLTNPDYMPFADAVTWAAQLVDRGLAEQQGGLEKNLQKPSPGSSNTDK